MPVSSASSGRPPARRLRKGSEIQFWAANCLSAVPVCPSVKKHKPLPVLKGTQDMRIDARLLPNGNLPELSGHSAMCRYVLYIYIFIYVCVCMCVIYAVYLY